MRYLCLLVPFFVLMQSCLADSSLGEELAAERGGKPVRKELLGNGKSGPMKVEVLGCGGKPLSGKGFVAPGKTSVSSAAPGGNKAQEGDSVEEMKAQLLELSREASGNRYQAAFAAAGKKKNCSINFAE